MSSYLVAMAVGGFRCLDGAAEGIPIRICATPDKRILTHRTESAQILSSTTATTPWHLFVSRRRPARFAAGVMENTAAISS
jgi:hypothetical protein